MQFLVGNGLAGALEDLGPPPPWIGTVTGGAGGSGPLTVTTAIIRAVQTSLNSLPTKLARLVVDGRSGTKTTARIKEFQRDMTMPQTGIIDRVLLALLGVPTGATGGAGGSGSGSSNDPTNYDAIQRAVEAAAAQAAAQSSRTGTNTGSAPGPGAVIRGAVIDVRISLGLGSTKDEAQTRAFAERLNGNGFAVVSVTDSDRLLTALGRTITVRVRIESNGYSSLQDAGSVVAGIAETVGFNVKSFEAFRAGTAPLSLGGGFGLGELFSGQTAILAVGAAAIVGIVVVEGVRK